MTVLLRELKKIRGKEVIAIAVVTAPGTVDDADTTKLYALENHLQIISDADPYTFYSDKGDYVFEEAAEGEVMPSELLKLVECTDAVHETGFVDIAVENSPSI